METVLKRLGRPVEVCLASDGVEAVEKIGGFKPDIVLMDLQMPRMDGIEATRRIRADTQTASTTIVAVTAAAVAGERERCLAAGMDDYIAKPIDLSRLREVLHAHSLGGARA